MANNKFMDIRIFIEYFGTIAQLPVTPESIKIQQDGNNETSQIITLGEVNILKLPKLKKMTIDCFFAGTADYPWVETTGEFQSPQFYINLINQIRNEKKPFTLIITGINITLMMCVENFETTWQYIDTRDIYYKLELTEYKPYETKTLEADTDTTYVRSGTIPESQTPVPSSLTKDAMFTYENTDYNVQPTIEKVGDTYDIKTLETIKSEIDAFKQNQKMTIKAKPPQQKRLDTLRIPLTHKTEPKDTLVRLAQYYYNDSSKWLDIAKLNDLHVSRPLEVGKTILLRKVGDLYGIRN